MNRYQREARLKAKMPVGIPESIRVANASSVLFLQATVDVSRLQRNGG
jgi:hypothetical protein